MFTDSLVWGFCKVRSNLCAFKASEDWTNQMILNNHIILKNFLTVHTFVNIFHRDVIPFHLSCLQSILCTGQFLFSVIPLFQEIHRMTSALKYGIHVKTYLYFHQVMMEDHKDRGLHTHASHSFPPLLWYPPLHIRPAGQK